MPGPQWVWRNSTPPKGVHETPVLVIGPETADDMAHVWWHLYDATIRIPALSIHVLRGYGSRTWDQPRLGWKYAKGVSNYAFWWADCEWWPRFCSNPADYSKSREKGLLKVFELKLQTLEQNRGRLIAFWDGECKETEMLMDLARPRLKPKRFDYRRC